MLNTKIYTIMKELFEIFEKDMMSDNLSKFELFIIAVAVPFIFVLVCILINLVPKA